VEDEWRLAVEDYRREKPLLCVAACETSDGPLAAAAGRAGIIPVWSLADQSLVTQLEPGLKQIEALSFGHECLFAGNDNGDLYGWPIAGLRAAQDNRKRLREWMDSTDVPPEKWPDQINATDYIPTASLDIPRAHVGRIDALTCGTWNRMPCVVSGGADGRLQSWQLDGSHIATIDVGEPITTLTTLKERCFAVGTSHGMVMIEAD